MRTERKGIVLGALMLAALVCAACLGTVIFRRSCFLKSSVDWVCNKTLHRKLFVSTLSVEGLNPKNFAHIAVKADLEEENSQFLSKFISNALATIQIFFPDNNRFGIPRPLLYNPYQVPNAAALQANTTVAQDGSGQYKTIGEAVMKAPYYDENVLLSEEKTNVMLLGDGRGQTIVASCRNVKDGYTTFCSATFAVSDKGFIAQDMTFANIAEPDKHQAVALRVGADKSAFYRCNSIGSQQTLYAHSLRHFYGPVDFILANTAGIFHNRNINVRTLMANQINTITPQGINDPFQNTGISIQNSRIVAKDRAPVRSSFPTYLARPLKSFSRTVVIQSFLGGYRVIQTAEEANFFSVDNFISRSAWLPSTGIPFNQRLDRTGVKF